MSLSSISFELTADAVFFLFFLPQLDLKAQVMSNISLSYRGLCNRKRVTPRCFETIPWKTGFASVFFGNTCIKGQPLLKYWSNLYSRKIKQSKTCHNMTRGFSYVMLRATGDAGCERERRTSCFLRMTYGKAFAGRAAEDKNNLKRAGSTRVQPVQAEFLTG